MNPEMIHNVLTHQIQANSRSWRDATWQEDNDPADNIKTASGFSKVKIRIILYQQSLPCLLHHIKLELPYLFIYNAIQV